MQSFKTVLERIKGIADSLVALKWVTPGLLTLFAFSFLLGFSVTSWYNLSRADKLLFGAIEGIAHNVEQLCNLLDRQLVLFERQVDRFNKLATDVAALQTGFAALAADEPQIAQAQKVLDSIETQRHDVEEQRRKILEEHASALSRSEQSIREVREYIETRFDRELSHMFTWFGLVALVLFGGVVIQAVRRSTSEVAAKPVA